MATAEPILFAPAGQEAYGERIAAELGVRLAPVEVREFEDGEHKSRPLVSVRDGDVYVLQSLHGDARHSVDERLVRLLFLLATLRDNHAGRVTAVIPYLAFARKDRRTKPRDPVTTRYLAQLLEAVGVDRVLAMDVHNPAAFENAFRIPVTHLEARPLLARELLAVADDRRVVVVSPDAGGYKRAERLRETLDGLTGERPGIAFLEKKRSEGVVSGEALVGEVDGAVACIIDDLISTGGTLARAAAACRRAGAARVYAAASHGLFTGDAARILGEAPLDGLWITDSVPAPRPELPTDRVRYVDAAPLLAEAIRRLHRGEPLTGIGDTG